MKPDYDSRINAGLSKEEIAKISGCEDQEKIGRASCRERV